MAIFKFRRDDNDNPKYDKLDDFEEDKHSHMFGGYTKDGRYYEGGHGENVDDEEKREAGRILRRARGDEDEDDDDD